MKVLETQIVSKPRRDHGGIPRATHEAVLLLGDTKLSVAVLADNSRVVMREDLFGAMGRTGHASDGAEDADEDTLQHLPNWLAAKNLKPFISAEFLRSSRRVKFWTAGPNRRLAIGYRAEFVVQLFNLYVTLAMEGANVRPHQREIAKRCNKMIVAWGIKGLESAIDDVTGYAHDRFAQAQRLVLEAFIAPEARSWELTFIDRYYREAYRLHGWRWQPGLRRHPGCLAGFTMRYVYGLLPEVVLRDLYLRNPKNSKGRRRFRFHQLLSKDIGHPQLRIAIEGVMSVMACSNNMDDFKVNYEARFGKQQLIPGTRPAARRLANAA